MIHKSKSPPIIAIHRDDIPRLPHWTEISYAMPKLDARVYVGNMVPGIGLFNLTANRNINIEVGEVLLFEGQEEFV